MSMDFYMTCAQCEQGLHVAQDGLGGFTFYSGEPDCMAALGRFLEAHSLCPQGSVRFVSESIFDMDMYEEIDWFGNIKPDLDREDPPEESR